MPFLSTFLGETKTITKLRDRLSDLITLKQGRQEAKQERQEVTVLAEQVEEERNEASPDGEGGIPMRTLRGA